MPSNFQISHTVNIIHLGGVIAYATEAVFGLGCDPENALAIERILEMKQRVPELGLILIASNVQQVLPYLGKLSVEEESAMQTYWPGATTLILPASENAPDLITGGRDTIAVRVSAHIDVRNLCDALGHPLVSTSANRSGEPAIKHYWQVAMHFGDKVDTIYPSTLGDSDKPSEIRIAKTGQILRPS